MKIKIEVILETNEEMTTEEFSGAVEEVTDQINAIRFDKGDVVTLTVGDKVFIF